MPRNSYSQCEHFYNSPDHLFSSLSIAKNVSIPALKKLCFAQILLKKSLQRGLESLGSRVYMSRLYEYQDVVIGIISSYEQPLTTTTILLIIF